MLKKRKRKGVTAKKRTTRKGMTIIEVVVSLLLMALAVVVMGRLTATRIVETESLNYQYTMQAADGMLYSIYQDFHACNSYTIERVTKNEDLTNPSLVTSDVFTMSFDMGASGIHIYQYDYLTYHFYFNGAEQFKCEDFTASGDPQHLFVSMKLANGERLEYTTYA